MLPDEALQQTTAAIVVSRPSPALKLRKAIDHLEHHVGFIQDKHQALGRLSEPGVPPDRGGG
jgi:hypothetical protein